MREARNLNVLTLTYDGGSRGVTRSPVSTSSPVSVSPGVSAHLDTVLRLTGPAAGALGTTSKPRHAAINNNKTIPSPENIGPAEYLVRKYNR